MASRRSKGKVSGTFLRVKKVPDTLVRQTTGVVKVFVLLALFLVVGGCRRFRTPGTKEARLIAAENLQLQKQLADCRMEITRITKDQVASIKALEDKLAASQKRNERLQLDIQKGIAERADSVVSTVMAENARLRAEIKRLLGQN